MTKYAVLAETNGKDIETWYNFIKVEGNEKTLKYLEKQFNLIDSYIVDELSHFDLDIENTVSKETAYEMSKLSVNSVMPHKVYNGKLEYINFGFKTKDSNEDMIVKRHEKLAYGSINEFIEEHPDDTIPDTVDASDSEGDDIISPPCSP